MYGFRRAHDVAKPSSGRNSPGPSPPFRLDWGTTGTRRLACDITGVNVVERGRPASQRQSDRTYPAKRPSHELAAQDKNAYHPTSQASMPRCAKRLKGNACTFQTARLPVTLLVNRSSTRGSCRYTHGPHFRIPVRCHRCQRLVWPTSNTPSWRWLVSSRGEGCVWSTRGARAGWVC
jgi:hypothetical protein